MSKKQRTEEKEKFTNNTISHAGSKTPHIDFSRLTTIKVRLPRHKIQVLKDRGLNPKAVIEAAVNKLVEAILKKKKVVPLK